MRRSLAASLLVVILATGCTNSIGGAARPAPNLKPRPLTGETINQVLLDGAVLSKMLNQPFKADPQMPPSFGGAEKLGDRYESGTPAECVGVVYMTQKIAYQSAQVKNIARESWWHDGDSVKVMVVEESVMSLPTAADADAVFAKLSAQWSQCDGKTLLLPSGVFVRDPITGVRVANSVVSATVSLGGDEHSVLAALPDGRAIGVRGNCLVEVDVTFFSNNTPTDRGSGDVNTSAIDVAHALMDKVSSLS